VTGVAIQVQDVSFAYGKSTVLEAIRLTVAQGQIYGLVGADGTGKTTLLRLACGQLAPASGEVKVLGQDPRSASLREVIAYMPQGFGLYPDLTVVENLHFFADLHGLDRPAASLRVRDLLQRTGLAGFEDRRAGHLSGGMMQKLALSCALVSEPQAMFLDEPTTGVDPVSRRAFWQLLDGVRAEGVAILYATANMDEAERCDRVGLLEHGRLRRQGTPLELSRGGGATFVTVAGADMRALRRRVRDLPGVDVAFPVGRRLSVWLKEGHAVEQFRKELSALRPAEPLEIRPAEASLQDAALREMALAREEPRGSAG
jgi:ABC-2 type transport system ATP-binding protein